MKDQIIDFFLCLFAPVIIFILFIVVTSLALRRIDDNKQ